MGMNKRLTDYLRAQTRKIFNLIGTDAIRKNILLGIPFWAASILTGLVAVGYTRLFGLAEDGLLRVINSNPVLLFIITPACFLLAYLLVQKFSPSSRGSGIPQVMASIDLLSSRNEQKVDRLLNLRIVLVKIGSSLLMVLGGGAIGREGPTIQIAASIFHVVRKITPRSWPSLSKQSFVLTGAAAGLAAAFNTPLGGVVFAMEELAKIHIRFFRTALFSAVIIAGLTAQGLLGPYLYLGYPDVRNLRFTVFFAVAGVAIVAGLAGAFSGKGIVALMAWKKSFSTMKNVFFITCVGLIIAATAYFVNAGVLGSGKELMNTVLFTDNKGASWHTALARIIGPILCFNTGAAGGVFAPALAAGASIGAFLSGMIDLAGSNANILILSGMVGFLTGVTRTPFTSAILVLEMTDRHSVIFHLLLAALLANLVSLMVDKHSLYEKLKRNFL